MANKMKGKHAACRRKASREFPMDGEEEKAYLAISFLPRTPLRAPPEGDGSSTFWVTKSILDIMLIQGISRFTIADIAERTPLEDI